MVRFINHVQETIEERERERKMLPCVDENCVKVRKIVGFIFFIQRTIGVGPEEGGKFSLFGVVRDTGIQDSSQ